MKYISLIKGLKPLLLMVCLAALAACEDFLEIPPPTNSITTESVFLSKGTIDQYMGGMYTAYSGGLPTVNCEYFADNCYNPTATVYYIEMTGEMLPTSNWAAGGWNRYGSINYANLMLEGLPTASVLDQATKDSYTGAALTVRAMSHYTLVSLYGDVPLNTTSKVEDNASKPRTPADEVYTRVISDLDEAIALLPETGAGDERYIDVRYVPLAISARVYTTMGNWAKAEAAADEVITNGNYSLLTNLDDIFFRGSNEIIFAAANTFNFNQSYKDWPQLGASYYPTRASSERTCTALSEDLLNSFEPGDNRRTAWVFYSNGANYPNPNNRYFFKKYYSPVGTTNPPGKAQDFVVLRLAEMYLIRAEARARQNNLSGAAADLNVIRNRAGLPNTTAATQTDLVNAIIHERRIELCGEGLRWDDLVRTGTADAVISALPYKVNWDSYKTLWPIPYDQIRLNDALVQNPGYDDN